MFNQQGQSSVEYLLVCGAIVAALLMPIDANDQNIMEICIQALRDWYSAFAFAKSLPTLPI